ncbi:FAD/NAD(P)-binding domain-containing protein [Choiromyces venosus 120613-1]|uniref:FAD/NAD(P)-binding domain-containing protein n=1 Tax=Choiromyces venosus 120613-1 TaxID=1336337 RepID=A0A3N4JSJ4_9PEZI|nr:FAD/NAD(P)-binding domain-containing protein [Choiromyces venosus 120613-1]
MTSKTSPPPRYNEIVCIGAGLSAIALAAQLHLQYSYTDLHIYERNAGIGGTWWANTYPGAACDIPSALYSFSFAPNPAWSCSFPPQAEIKAYIDSVAAQYGVPERTSLSTAVKSACWDDQRDRWTLSLKDLTTGEEHTHECKILFTAQGLLAEPNIPALPGLENFRGKVFHSAQWNHSTAISGKKVAIIGSGCSATQIIPAIASSVSVVRQFIRNPHWIIPPPVIEYSEFNRWTYRNLPFVYKFHRLLVFAMTEWNFRLFGMSQWSQGEREKVKSEAVGYMKKEAPEKYWQLLRAKDELACKRRILDGNGYFKTLNRGNVHVHKQPAIQIMPGGIKPAGEEQVYEADVIVLATGFQTSGSFFPTMKVRGRDGVSAEKHWEGMGGAGAYNTTAMHGFPNMFMILGPNSATGHTSVIVAIENTVDYTLRVLRPVLTHTATRVEVKASAEIEYVTWIQSELKKTVFSSGCTSWYKSDTWNGMAYPWTQIHFYYSCLFVNWKDWDVTVCPLLLRNECNKVNEEGSIQRRAHCRSRCGGQCQLLPRLCWVLRRGRVGERYCRAVLREVLEADGWRVLQRGRRVLRGRWGPCTVDDGRGGRATDRRQVIVGHYYPTRNASERCEVGEGNAPEKLRGTNIPNPLLCNRVM